MYSGDDGEPMCTMDDPKALAARWFRGIQKTDAKGRVDFGTCFPGWYHGRTVHIHLTVTTADGHTVTTQLFFDDALVDAIVAKQPGYDTRGLRDTNNTNDGVIGKDEVVDYLFTSMRQHDGTMLASKAIVLQTHGAVCETKGGAGGPGGPGGPGGRGARREARRMGRGIIRMVLRRRGGSRGCIRRRPEEPGERRRHDLK